MAEAGFPENARPWLRLAGRHRRHRLGHQISIDAQDRQRVDGLVYTVFNTWLLEAAVSGLDLGAMEDGEVVGHVLGVHRPGSGERRRRRYHPMVGVRPSESISASSLADTS